MSKILYAASTVSHIQSFHTDYIEALRAEGHTVLVMARGEGADFDIPFEKKLFSRKNAACRRMIKKILLRERFDSILLNTSLAAFHIRLALPLAYPARVVNLVHGYLFSYRSSFIKRTLLLASELFLRRRTDAVMVMNEEDFGIATRHRLGREISFVRGMGVAERHAACAPDAVRARTGDEDAFVLLFVGELSARKNQELLIRSLSSLRTRVPNAVLWLIGEGDEREALSALVAELGLSDAVRFLGRRADVADYMVACDLYVSASHIEGLPFNIAEALGCGCTVLASRVKGHEDMLRHGESGFLYEDGDGEELVSLAASVAEGKAVLSDEKIRAAFLRYEKSEVFDETLSAMRVALALS